MRRCYTVRPSLTGCSEHQSARVRGCTVGHESIGDRRATAAGRTWAAGRRAAAVRGAAAGRGRCTPRAGQAAGAAGAGSADPGCCAAVIRGGGAGGCRRSGHARRCSAGQFSDGALQLRTHSLAGERGARVGLGVPEESAPLLAELQPVQDATLYEHVSEPGVANGSCEHWFVGYNGKGLVTRGLLRFDRAAALPAGSRIVATELHTDMSRS